MHFFDYIVEKQRFILFWRLDVFCCFHDRKCNVILRVRTAKMHLHEIFILIWWGVACLAFVLGGCLALA